MATNFLQVVDIQELQRVEDALWEKEDRAKGSRRFISFTHPKTRRFTLLPLAQFIANGIPYGMSGRVSLMKKKDYTTRLEGLHRLEAYVWLLSNDETLSFDNVTEGMVVAQAAEIQRLRDTPLARASKWFRRPSINMEAVSRRRAA